LLFLIKGGTESESRSTFVYFFTFLDGNNMLIACNAERNGVRQCD